MTNKKIENDSNQNKDNLNIPVYLSVDDKTRHWIYFRANPRTEQEKKDSIHKEDFGGSMVSRTVKVHNGRGNNNLTFDEASFELVECPTALSKSDFYEIQKGNADLVDKYNKEVTNFVKSKLGCDKVICFHSQVRNAAKAGVDSSGVQGYAGGGPHTDSSPISGDELALSVVAEGEKYERYCYANLWRNIADTPIENNHLAMLDERTTVKPDDYITKDLYGDGYEVVQYGLSARHAESTHKWYYYPQMTRDEGILFKQMDSDWTKSGRICFHMSIDEDEDQSKSKKQPSAMHPRESIELRFICLWEKADVDSMPTKENTNESLVKEKDSLKEAANNNDVATLSTGNLLKELFIRLISFWSFGLIGRSTSGANKSTYTGNPEDYLDKFVEVVGSYPKWPAFAKNWVKGQMKGEDVDSGIAKITKELVNDTMGYQGTKNFTTEEKEQIVKFLLADPGYSKETRNHWSELDVSDSDASNSTFTGNPEDYLDKFVKLVESYPGWPRPSKNWAKGQMKGEDIESGIAKITEELVNDTKGYQGTKNFTTEEKKEIVKFLLADPSYSKETRKHWSKLV